MESNVAGHITWGSIFTFAWQLNFVPSFSRNSFNSICIWTVRAQLLFSFGTLDSFLSGLGRNWLSNACGSAQMARKSVWISWAKQTTSAKGGFFSESAMCFLDLQISKKNIPKNYLELEIWICCLLLLAGNFTFTS